MQHSKKNMCTIPAVAGNKRRCHIADWVAVDSKAFAFAFAFAVVVVVVAMDASSVAGGYSYSQAAAAVDMDIAVAGATGKDMERRWVAVAAVDSCMTEMMTPAEWKKASHSFVRVL